MNELWAVIPFLDCWEATRQAAEDALAQQGVKVRVLLIDNGGSAKTRQLADSYCASVYEHALVWHHKPELPSLAAVWNQALDFVWAAGGEHAWVMNNDIRVAPGTAAALLSQWTPERWKGGTPLFVSAVGVTPEQFNAQRQHIADDIYLNQGGPDFSCFIISKDCHQAYRFDEQFSPCYCEDLDYHRRLMLGGDGRRIFSVNLPYLHIDNGSGTLKSMSPERRAAKENQITHGSRAYYVRKWGGPVNHETNLEPFCNPAARDLLPDPPGTPHLAITTPELQREVWADGPQG